jgi:DNA-directed RNA polymerase sigma subunit (sigma70/sigma32)
MDARLQSLDEPRSNGDNNTSLYSIHPDRTRRSVENEVLDNELQDAIIIFLGNNLTPRQKEVLGAIFSHKGEHDPSNDLIGNQLGISGERVRQHLENIKEGLRKFLEDRHLSSSIPQEISE